MGFFRNSRSRRVEDRRLHSLICNPKKTYLKTGQQVEAVFLSLARVRMNMAREAPTICIHVLTKIDQNPHQNEFLFIESGQPVCCVGGYRLVGRPGSCPIHHQHGSRETFILAP